MLVHLISFECLCQITKIPMNYTRTNTKILWKLCEKWCESLALRKKKSTQTMYIVWNKWEKRIECVWNKTIAKCNVVIRELLISNGELKFICVCKTKQQQQRQQLNSSSCYRRWARVGSFSIPNLSWSTNNTIECVCLTDPLSTYLFRIKLSFCCFAPIFSIYLDWVYQLA